MTTKKKNTKKQKKSGGIPKSYRKPMKVRQYGKLTRMLTDKDEKAFLDELFLEDENGRLVYSAPSDKKDVKRAAQILVKLKKARSGPRTVRIAIVLLIIGIPTLFNLFFLDSIASRYLERGLENLSGTDVGVIGLNIMPLRGRIDLNSLSFASESDSMLDEWVIRDIAVEINPSSLAWRRMIVDIVEARIDYRVARTYEAEYPDGSVGGKISEAFTKLDDPGSFDWIPREDLPTGSIELVRNLRGDAEVEYEGWAEEIEADTAAVTDLVERTERFVSEPLPDQTDLSAWGKRLDEGRRLTAEYEKQRNLVDRYRTEVRNASASLEEAGRRAREAVEEDLKKIESALTLDSNLINRWIQSAVIAYAGPRAGPLVSRALNLKDRAMDSRSENPDESRGNPGRMKRGRIVYFPAKIPPRFTIGMLNLSGEGIAVEGSHVGIDHDLAGFPSTLNILLDGAAGMEGRIQSSLIIDGRIAAANFIEGELKADSWDWSGEFGTAGRLGGGMTVEGTFKVPAGTEYMESEGMVVLDDWETAESGGSLDFITADSPDLGFHYKLAAGRDQFRLGISIDSKYLTDWSRMIGDAFLAEGTEKAKEALRNSVDADLSGLDSLGLNWSVGLSDLTDLDSMMDRAEDELNEMLDDLSGGALGNVPLDKPAEVLGGLKSLF